MIIIKNNYIFLEMIATRHHISDLTENIFEIWVRYDKFLKWIIIVPSYMYAMGWAWLNVLDNEAESTLTS